MESLEKRMSPASKDRPHKLNFNLQKSEKGRTETLTDQLESPTIKKNNWSFVIKKSKSLINDEKHEGSKDKELSNWVIEDENTEEILLETMNLRSKLISNKKQTQMLKYVDNQMDILKYNYDMKLDKIYQQLGI